MSEIEAMKAKLKAFGGRSASREHRGEPTTSLAAVEKSRAARKSKNKGSTYERDIAKLFAEWTGDVVKRTPLSGGWAKADFGVHGDLVFKVVTCLHVECKKQEGWLLEDLLTGARSMAAKRSLSGWWDQTVKDCDRSKIPLLVFTRNLRPDYVMLYAHDLDRFDKNGWWQFVPHFIHYIETTEKPERVVIMELRWLLAKVRPPKGSPLRTAWKPSEVE